MCIHHFLYLLQMATQSRRWECIMCEESYALSGKLAEHNLLRHFRVVHQASNPHNCNVCSSNFATKISLGGHKVKVHGLDNISVCDKFRTWFIYTQNLIDYQK